MGNRNRKTIKWKLLLLVNRVLLNPNWMPWFYKDKMGRRCDDILDFYQKPNPIRCTILLLLLKERQKASKWPSTSKQSVSKRGAEHSLN